MLIILQRWSAIPRRHRCRREKELSHETVKYQCNPGYAAQRVRRIRHCGYAPALAEYRQIIYAPASRPSRYTSMRSVRQYLCPTGGSQGEEFLLRQVPHRIKSHISLICKYLQNFRFNNFTFLHPSWHFPCFFYGTSVEEVKAILERMEVNPNDDSTYIC